MPISQSVITPRGLSVFRHMPPAEDLAKMLAGSNLLQITATGWTSTLVGSGTVTQGITNQRIATGTTASSSSLLTLLLWNNFGIAADNSQFINWGKKTYVIINVTRVNSDAEGVARIQVKESAAIGALGAKGIGIQIDNLAISGESYGTSLATVDLGTSAVSTQGAKIMIVHDPTIPRIDWYVNNVLKGSQLTSGKIPSGLAGAASYFVLSVVNGATGGVNYLQDNANPIMWQEL